MLSMQIKQIDPRALTPYGRNTKKHDQTQIDNVAESIRQFGFVQPVVVDKDNTIVIGHCRVLASIQLGMDTVPCVAVDDLTPEQVQALRIVDNKTNESPWDYAMLELELPQIDLGDFDFGDLGVAYVVKEATNTQEEDTEQEYERKKREFEERMESGELSEDSEEYQEFVEKFKPKKTTDDCYTPPIVYDAVADYVAEHYGLKKSDFVRPFYPNGDYQKERYKPTDVVVDNPPFSIFSEIIKFYLDKNIKFFLFAPNMTLFGCSQGCSCISCGVKVTYDNGAVVNTSFITNLETCAFRSCPELYQAVKKANDLTISQTTKTLPKYIYPKALVTPSVLELFSKFGVCFEVSKNDSFFTRGLDSQKQFGKAIYGGGFLISEIAQAEREKAEIAQAEREKAEREKAEVWELSDRELEIIKSLK